jgi:glucuronosyltransferase
LTHDLLARGHSLTVVTTDPENLNHPNLTEIDISFCYNTMRRIINFVQFKETMADEYSFLEALIQITTDTIHDQFNHPEVQKLLKNENNQTFDAVIVEYLIFHPWYAMSLKYNAPLIGFSSLDVYRDTHERMGNAFNPAIHPGLIQDFVSPMTFIQRWKSLKFYLWNKFYYDPKVYAEHDLVIKKYFPELKTSVDELRNSLQLLMVNTHPVMGFIRPLVPTTIQLGFMHIGDSKPLPEDLKNYLDSSKNGVIYMSLGSNVRSSELKKEFVDIFIKVFKTLNYDVLWKWEVDDFPDKPKNLKTLKWLPQADLLGHPNIKLFITQGGQVRLFFAN